MDYGMHYSGSSHSCPPSHSTEKHKSGKKRHTPRDKLSEERLRALREKDAERKRNRRVQMTEEERKQEREKDKARKANKRKQQKAEAMAAEQRTVLPPVESLLPPYSPVYPPPQQPPPRVATTLKLAPIVDLPMRYNQY